MPCLCEQIAGSDRRLAPACSAQLWIFDHLLACGFTRSHFEKLVLAHPNIGLQIIKNLSARIT